MRFKTLPALTLIFVLFAKCSQTGEQGDQEMKPTARGEMDDIILVMDSTQWKGDLGEEIRGLYKGFIIGLPQDESKFRLNRVSPFNMNNALRLTSNLIFVVTLDNKSDQSKEIRSYFTDASLKMISRDSSLFMTVRKDEFANGQVVLYLYSQSEELLRDQIKGHRQQLEEVFEGAVRERTRTRVLASRNTSVEKAILERHRYELQIPFGWNLAKDLNDFIWLRRLEPDSELNVFIHEAPYQDQSVFNDIGTYRDKITEQYLMDGEKPTIYITRQQQVNVFTERVNFDGKFGLEARGLWRISDNSGGGPFVSYTLVDEGGTLLYYIEGYVYAPGGKKKKLIREVEAILSTFKTPGKLNPKQ